MRKPPIATIVNFCTNESRTLKSCLEEVLHFSEQVIVVVCDHFFDGTPEDRALLEQIYSAFPECLFIEYPFIPNEIPKSIFKKVDPDHFWHSLSRLIATKFLKEEVETVLFLDADEVPEGKRVRQWFETSDYGQYVTVKLASYWYFRLPECQALQWEDSPVLIQKKALSSEILLHTEERQALYDLSPGPKKRMATGIEGVPMIHHYSWVRTKEEMLKKVKSWSHKRDRDWEKLVVEEFSRPFSGVDFVHGYSYKTVSCPFQISLAPTVFSSKGIPCVKRLQKKEVLKQLRFSGAFRKFFSLLGI